jgi:hypothetical protein
MGKKIQKQDTKGDQGLSEAVPFLVKKKRRAFWIIGGVLRSMCGMCAWSLAQPT